MRVVAEVGQTYGGGESVADDVERACAAVEAFAAAGAWAVKFQMVDPETIATRDAEPYWADATVSTQREAFACAPSLPYEGWAQIVECCNINEVVFLATPFDLDAVETLVTLDVEWVKIASGDITYTPLLDAVADAGLRVILSTGAASAWEIRNALRRLVVGGARSPVVMACSLVYPCPPETAWLSRITGLRRDLYRLGCEVGYSDHTTDTRTGYAAAAFGATMLEKHVTCWPDDPRCADNAMALTPEKFAEYVDHAEAGGWMHTSPSGGIGGPEAAARVGARRAGRWAVDIAAGDHVVAGDATYLRPCPPEAPRIEDVVGWLASERTLARDVRKGDLIVAEDFGPSEEM